MLGRLLFVALILALTTTRVDAQNLDVLLGASSDEHVWLVLKSEDPAQGVQLLHQYAPTGDAAIQTQILLPQMPAAIAAWSDRLWLIFPPEGEGDNRRRETFTVRVRLEPTTGLYMLEPRDRLGVLPSLAGDGELAAIAGAAGGPLALIVPRRARRGSEPKGATAPRLLQLRNDAWVERPLPSLGDSRAWWLLTGGERGQFVSILSDDPERRRHAIASRRGLEDDWTPTSLEVDLEAVTGVSRVGGRYPLVVDSPSEGTLRLSYLRPGRLVPLAEMPRPDNDWAILGTRDDIRLFERGPDDMTFRLIDQVTGTLMEPRTLGAPVPSGRVWYVSVLLAITITALLFAFLVRPGSSASPVSLPADQEVLGRATRLTELLIDLFPGALLSVLVLGCRPVDLIAMPLAAAPEETGPYLLMIALTFLHTTVSEMLSSRTLGKVLVGARVVTLDGDRPRGSQILVRNVFKLVTLLIPPLVVVVVFNPNLQGLGDVVARTLVVHEPEPAGEKDR